MRMFAGLGIGLVIGCMAGLAGGLIKPFCHVFKPIMGMIQVVPPISWLILAMIWFGYNGKASVFIVVMAVAASMFICISDGIGSADRS